MLEIMQRAAREAGEVLLKYYKKGVIVKAKTSHQNLVTKADIASQKIIQRSILSQLHNKGYSDKEIGFIGEENLNNRKKYTFVIDPLDGTTNFASGINFFGISIGLFNENRLTHGIIYDPIKKDFYWAVKKKGGFKNNKKLHMNYAGLKNCMCATYFTSQSELRNKQFQLLKKLSTHVRAIRMMGSAVLQNGMLAENIVNIHFEHHTYIWDLAAAKLLVEESGGLVTNFHGKDLQFDLNKPHNSFPFLACHPKLLPEILPFFNAQTKSDPETSSG